MDSMRHPVANAVRISSCVTRRGPQSPGWRSLKQSMCKRPPGERLRPGWRRSARALAVVEDVEEPAVEHRVELLPQINEAKGVRDDEASLEAPFDGLRLRQLDGPRRRVDPHSLEAERGRHEGVLAGATTDVEHPADQAPGRGQAIEGRLGSPDVPRRGAVGVDGVEVVAEGVPGGGGEEQPDTAQW